MSKNQNVHALFVVTLSLILLSSSVLLLLVGMQNNYNNNVYAQSAPTKSFEIPAFNMVAGDTQTQNLRLSVNGVNEITITSITFGNNTQSWFKLGKSLPLDLKSQTENSNNITTIIPITVTVPANYTGSGGSITTTVQFQYKTGDQNVLVSDTHPIQVNVYYQPIWKTALVIGAGLAVIAVGFIIYKRKFGGR